MNASQFHRDPDWHPTPEITPKPAEKRRRPLWARATAWAAGSVAVFLLMAFVTIAVLMHSARFHHYLLTLAERKASDAIGAPVRLQNFAVHLSSLSLDLYGLKISGAAPYPNPPLLQADRIAAGVRVVSILHGKWYLESVRIDHPVVQIFTSKNGVSNLPQPHSDGKSKTNLFDLGIRHAVIDRGVVYFNDEKSALEADLHNLSFRSSFDSLQQKYSGAMSYRDGHLRLGSFNPIPHDLQAQFAATPSSLDLTQARLISGASQLEVTGTLTNYNRPNIQARYNAAVDAGEVRRILKDPTVPTGVIRASGSIRYQNDPSRPAVDSVTLDGELSGRQLEVHASGIRARIDDIAAHYSLANGDALVRGFRVHLLGGEINGTLAMRDIGGDSHSNLNATLSGVSLAQLKGLAPSASMTRDLSVRGVLNADANATWGRSLHDLAGRANATLRGSVSRAGAAGALPVNGVFNLAYRGPGEEIALTQSYLRMPQTTLVMNGGIGNRSSLAFQFKSADLREVEAVADLFRAPSPGHPVEPLGLAGSASFDGLVRGSLASPRLTGELAASGLQVKGTAWRTLRANVDIAHSSASVLNGDLEPATRGRISFNASAGLTRWSFTKTSSVRAELHASQLNAADLAKIASFETPIAGTLAANVSVHGTASSPVGEGSVSLTRAKLYDEPIEAAKLTFAGTGGEVHGNLDVHLTAGSLQSQVAIRPGQQSYTAQLTADGIRLDRLQTLKDRNLDLSGVLNLNAQGQGTFQNPQLDATLQIPQLEVRKQAINGLTLQMKVAQHVASASLNARALNNPVRAQAKVNLTGDYFTQATIDTESIALQPLFAIYAPSQSGELSGVTELHATLRGPLKKKNLLQAHITLPMLKVDYSNTVQLAATAPVHLDYANGVIALQHTAIRGTDTNLELQGSYPLTGKAPPSILLMGAVDLKLAQLFNPDVRSSGELKFNINSYNSGGALSSGQVQIVNASFANGDLPIGLQHGNAVLTLTKDRLNIDSFQGSVGGGTVTARGGLAYSPAVRFELGATAKGVHMLYPQGVRESLDADLRLTGTTENALLGGRVSIADLSFTPSFDLTSFIGEFSGGVSPPPTPGFSQNLRLNLAVNSTNNVNLVSRTLSLDGTANLQVRGTAAQPVILGRINLNNGDLIFNGDRFVLNGGTIEFVNPTETQPVVNVALSTTIQQYNINLRFNGPIDQLRTNYTSDPSLPAADIINLLAFGETTEANAANPSTPGNQAAESLLASQVSSQVTSRVSKIAGISQLSINPVLSGAGSQGPAGANVTIQQRVTGNLFVTFSTNVASTENQVIMGQYRLSPRVSVTGTRDQNGGFAFDTIIQKNW